MVAHSYARRSNNANQIQNSFLAQNAKQNIDVALQSQGFEMVRETQNPNLFVLASGELPQQKKFNQWPKQMSSSHNRK